MFTEMMSSGSGGGGGRLKHVKQVASYNPVSGAHSETLDNPDHIYWILGSIYGKRNKRR